MRRSPTRRCRTPRFSAAVAESFEPRVLFAIDVAVGVGQAARAVQFTDTDGTAATVKVSGGAATVTFDGLNLTQTTAGGTVVVAGTNVEMTNLVMTGTNPKVTITTTPTGTDSRVGLGGMSAAGPVAAVTGRGVILRGITTLSNGIGKLDLAGVQEATITINRGSLARLVDAALSLGAVQDTSITSQQPFRQLRVASWGSATATPDQITTLRINTIQSAGDFVPDISLSGNGQVVGRPILGNVRVAGALAAGAWNVAAGTSRIAAGSVGGNWQGNFTTVSNFTVAGDLSGELTAEAINSLSAGSITDADIRLTRPFAPRATAINRLSSRGAITDTDIRTNADIGTVMAASIDNSIIYAGIDVTGGGGGGGGNRALPNDSTDFVNAATIRNVTIRNRTGAAAFADSNIAAATLGRMNLGTVQVINNGNPFGLAALEVRSLSAVGAAGQPIRAAQLAEPAESIAQPDFEVRIF